MLPLIPWYVTVIVLAISIILAVTLSTIIWSAAGRADLPSGTRRTVRIGSAIFLGMWLGAAFVLAPPPDSLLSREPFYITPLIPLFAIIPATIAALALWRSPALRLTIAATSLPALIGVQFYRAIGVVFLILLSQGQLPAHFALPAGWGDIAIGLAAPLVALALTRGLRGARTLGIGWNVVGLLDLVVAIGMGTGFLTLLLTPEVGRVPPAAAMGVFPLILVPTFAVPLSVMLHLLALTRLVQGARLGSGLMPEPAR
jgi:hypothetical protein